MSKTEAIKYSIIIPHHNIPDLLERCLKSIPVRDDVQTLVVDDLSAPEYQEPLHELEKKYPSVTFIYSQTNGGAGRARNIGLEHALGDYLVFADADDYFVPDLSGIMDSYLSADEDVIYFRNKEILLSDDSEPILAKNWFDEVFDRYFATLDDKEIRCNIFTPWAKFFRRSFIEKEHIRFDEIPYSNDVFFVVSAGCKATKVKVDDRIIYCYLKRNNSLTSSFLQKPGELAVRADACFRAQVLMKQYGVCFHRMPMTDLLSKCYHTDRALFKKYIRRASEAYRSTWDAVRQIRWWEVGIWNKCKLYLVTILCLL